MNAARPRRAAGSRGRSWQAVEEGKVNVHGVAPSCIGHCALVEGALGCRPGVQTKPWVQQVGLTANGGGWCSMICGRPATCLGRCVPIAGVAESGGGDGAIVGGSMRVAPASWPVKDCVGHYRCECGNKILHASRKHKMEVAGDPNLADSSSQIPRRLAEFESPWNKLTPELHLRVANYLPVSDVVMGLKLSCKDAAACLREDYSTIQLAARPAQRRQPNHLNPVISASPWPAWQFVAHWGRPEPWRLLTLRQRQRLLCLAASSGDAPSLDAALAHCGCSLSSEVLISAAAAGCTAACKRLLEEGCEADLNAACAAAEAGHRHLCALLWSKRCWDHTFLDGDGGGDGPDAEDLARVAEAACAGGHAHVLQWLEMHEGLYDDAERWGREYRRQEINEGLAAAAARGGHVPLLQQLLAKLPQPQAGSGQDINWSRLLCDVALGCPLPVLRELAGRWRQLEPPQPRQQQQQQQQLQLGAQRGGGVGRDILLRALGSHTPDWRDKAEWVLSRRSELLAAATTGPGSALRPDGVGGYDWAAAQPDYEQRLRYLVTDKGARSLPAEAAEAAAAAGDVGALRFLLEECGMRLPDTCVSGAAQCGQHAVLEFLRGRGQLPSYSGGGRTLNAGEAPVGVLAAAAVVAARDARHAGYAMSHAYQERDFWSRVFSQAASQGADVTTLRYLHEALGAQVQLRCIAQAGSLEQLEWALGVALAGGDAAPPQLVSWLGPGLGPGLGLGLGPAPVWIPCRRRLLRGRRCCSARVPAWGCSRDYAPSTCCHSATPDVLGWTPGYATPHAHCARSLIRTAPAHSCRPHTLLPQGPAPGALLQAALDSGNLVAAALLHARGLAPAPLAVNELVRLCDKYAHDSGGFGALRWILDQLRNGHGQGGGQTAADKCSPVTGKGGVAGDAGPGAAAAAGAAATAGSAEAASCRAASGLTDAEWAEVLLAVGVAGLLHGRFSTNQWEWLRAAFLASPVSPHATAASTAQRFAGWVARDLIRRRMHALEEEPVGSAGSGHTEAAAAEKAARLERERVAGVMEVRAAAVAGVETSFRDGAQREDKWMADADAQAENEAAMYDDAGYNTDRDDIDDDDLGDPFYPY